MTAGSSEDRTQDDTRERLIRVEEQLNSHVRLWVETEKLKGEALTLQAEKYEDRLLNLNGEAGRITKVLALSIPREVFEAAMKSTIDARNAALADIVRQIEAVDGRVDELKTYVDQQTGGRLNQNQMIALVLAAVAVLSFVVAYFNTQ